jgi:hypothetical protein
MRRALIAITILLCPPPAQAFESLWVHLEVLRALEPLCPAEMRRAMGALSVAALEAPNRIIRRRETEFTARVKTGGDFAAADRQMTAYAASIATQVRDGVANAGCTTLMTRFGLLTGTPPTLEQFMDAVRNTPLPSTERPDEMPAEDRIGTEAAYPLQRILLDLATKDRTCDRRSVQVMRMGKTSLETKNTPPFVGTPMQHEERWRILCDGRDTAFRVSFQQDARHWRAYKLQHDGNASTERLPP